MARFVVTLAVVVCGGFAVAAEPKPAFPEGKHGKGELKYVNGMPVVVVRGTPAEVGEQLGMLTVKVAPRPSPPLSAETTPPWSSTRLRTMASPSPRPPYWRPMEASACR